MPSRTDNQLEFQSSWKNASKRIVQDQIGPTMKIIGKVAGFVTLTDIGKNIPFNQIIELTESEINKSKHLQIALKNKWIEITEDRAMLRRCLGVKADPVNYITDEQKMMSMAKEMAKEMAKILISESMSDIKVEISQLKTALNEKVFVQNSNTQNIQNNQTNIKEEKKFVFEDDSENVVIDVGETNADSEISNIGVEKKEKINIKDTLEKMKQIRRKPL